MASKHPSHTQAVIIVLVFIAGLILINTPNLTGNATFTQELSEFQGARISITNSQQKYPELFSTMNWQTSEAELKQYETRLNTITHNSTSDSVQRNEVNKLYTSWQELTDPLPKSIRLEKQFVDRYIAEPQDTEPYTQTPKETYLYQQQFTITSTITVYDVELYSGITKRISLITTHISSKKPTGQVQIIQEIPKEIPLTAIKNRTPGVSNQGHVYRTTFSNINSPITLTYALDGTSINAEEFFNYKTLIISEQKTQQDLNTSGANTEEKDYSCGNNICETPFEDELVCPEDCSKSNKQFPWLLVILIGLATIALLIYFNAYKGKGDLHHISKGKSPFLTKEDLEKVKDYIKKSNAKNINKKDISKQLVKQGWTQTQIIYAYTEAEWEMRKVLIDKAPKKISENIEPVIIYIKKCLEINMDRLIIKNKLLSKGWKATQIEEAFKKAR